MHKMLLMFYYLIKNTNQTKFLNKTKSKKMKNKIFMRRM